MRTVRGHCTESGITVYQAYPVEIAERAVEAGTFVPPFKRERMTWIKPSFLWMMYRCGWARKPGQERVLSIEISREGFEWALAHASLSHFDSRVHESQEAWRREVRESPVRVQWDPERSLDLAPQSARAIQIGLSGEAVTRYVEGWITRISDITGLVHDVHRDVREGRREEALRRLPVETAYPLPEAVRARVGAASCC